MISTSDVTESNAISRDVSYSSDEDLFEETRMPSAITAPVSMRRLSVIASSDSIKNSADLGYSPDKFSSLPEGDFSSDSSSVSSASDADATLEEHTAQES
jgi:hypothetical protein